MSGAGQRRRRSASSTRRVTMQDVGRTAGVSAQTVSRVLSSPERVSERTRRRVQQAIIDTGYVPNLAASHLASNRSRTVSAIVPVMSASIFADTLTASASLLTQAGYQTTVESSDYDTAREEELVRGAVSRRPDGFLIVGTLHTTETIRLLRDYGAPVVETWDCTSKPLDTLVGFSNRDAMLDMVRYLVSRGHRRLTFAGVLRSGDDRTTRRFEGFRAGVEALLPDEPVRVVDLVGRRMSMDTGSELLSAVLERHPETTAAVFTSDIYAAAAVLAARRRGISVPNQLAITGFGDFEVARHLVPSLTTVHVDAAEIGTRAAQLLLARMQDSPVETPAVDVGYRIVPRESA